MTAMQAQYEALTTHLSEATVNPNGVTESLVCLKHHRLFSVMMLVFFFDMSLFDGQNPPPLDVTIPHAGHSLWLMGRILSINLKD